MSPSTPRSWRTASASPDHLSDCHACWPASVASTSSVISWGSRAPRRCSRRHGPRWRRSVQTQPSRWWSRGPSRGCCPRAPACAARASCTRRRGCWTCTSWSRNTGQRDCCSRSTSPPKWARIGSFTGTAMPPHDAWWASPAASYAPIRPRPGQPRSGSGS
jgi:hypothetical protein